METSRRAPPLLRRLETPLSLYPATKRLLETFRDYLGDYEVNKSTIRFPLDQPVPTQLIARIARFRAQEIAGTKPKKSALQLL